MKAPNNSVSLVANRVRTRAFSVVDTSSRGPSPKAFLQKTRLEVRQTGGIQYRFLAPPAGTERCAVPHFTGPAGLKPCRQPAYHTHGSRRSQPGFPDLTMDRGGELIFAELKTDSPKSVETDDQKAWSAELHEVAAVVWGNIPIGAPVLQVFLWRPRDGDRTGVAAVTDQLTVLSLGAGVQSTTMALMAAPGEINPMPDCAIFADTGWEPRAVYDHLAWLRSPNVLDYRGTSPPPPGGPSAVDSRLQTDHARVGLVRSETPIRAATSPRNEPTRRAASPAATARRQP